MSGSLQFLNKGEEHFSDQQLQYTRKEKGPNNIELAMLGGTWICIESNDEENKSTKQVQGCLKY